MRAWMEQWRSGATALEEQRRMELRQLTTQGALAASEALLALASSTSLPAWRRSNSGLVEQQAILHRPRR
jgi:hypothetical protein